MAAPSLVSSNSSNPVPLAWNNQVRDHESILVEIEPVKLNYGSIYSVPIKNTRNEWVWIVYSSKNVHSACRKLQIPASIPVQVHG